MLLHRVPLFVGATVNTAKLAAFQILLSETAQRLCDNEVVVDSGRIGGDAAWLGCFRRFEKMLPKRLLPLIQRCIITSQNSKVNNVVLFCYNSLMLLNVSFTSHFGSHFQECGLK